MKNPAVYCLILITSIFFSLIVGVYVGRGISGDPIWVERFETAPKTTEESSEATDHIENTEKININTATLEQLDTLPGIGPVLAQRIIDYREEHGPFTDLSELTLVSGIGVNILNNLLDYATVGG